MLWPLFYGSSSCASTCLRATSPVPRTGWTQPSTVVPLSVASSASLLLWQLANHRVYEEANTEGQNLSSNLQIVFETWDCV